jgi:hypothetical protein
MFGGLGDLAGDVVDAFERPVRDAMDAFEQTANAASDAATAVYQAIEEGIEAVLALKDEFVEALDDATRAIVKAARSISEAIDSIIKTVDGVADWIKDSVGIVLNAIQGVALDIVEALAGAVDWLEENLPEPVDWVLNDFLPAVYSVVKLLAAVAALVAAWPAFLAATFICKIINDEYGDEYGKVIQAILQEKKRYKEMFNIISIPARQRIVIFSDIHRWAGDDEQEIGAQRDTRDLHDRVLEHYAIEGWTLIENGDVEDYWLRGGSFYGAAYDVASMLPGPVFDAHFLDAGLIGGAQFHLSKIIKNHASTYARIKGLFLADPSKPRYFRTAGNHDDINRQPAMQAGLRHYFPGLGGVADYILLKDLEETVAVIAHGHQTDAWNSGACSFLGRATTSVASSVRDLDFVIGHDLKQLGYPAKEKTATLWGATDKDQLDQVGPFGANTELGSLDEVGLFNSFRKIWRSWGEDIEGGPYVLLGHTHVPLMSPANPVTNGIWWKYFNSGCCIFDHMITAIEWEFDGASPKPDVRIVAWRWSRDVGRVPPDAERAIVARRLVTTKNNQRLGAPVDSPPVDIPFPPGF